MSDGPEHATRSLRPDARRPSRSPTGSTPTSSPTGPGGSTTPASSSGRRACSASTRAPPSGARGPTSRPSGTSPRRRCARWSTRTTTATTRSATPCSPPRRSSPTSAPGPRRSRSAPPRTLPFWDNPDWGELPLEPPFLTFTDEVALHAGDTAHHRQARRHAGAHHQRRAGLVPRAVGAVLRRPGLQRRHAVPADGVGGGRDRGAGERRAAARRQHRRARPRAGVRRAPPRSRPRSTTCGSSSTWPPAAGRQACRRWRRPGTTDLGRFAAWPDAERIVGNLHRAYAELDGTPRGGADRRPGRPGATWSPTTAASR